MKSSDAVNHGPYATVRRLKRARRSENRGQLFAAAFGLYFNQAESRLIAGENQIIGLRFDDFPWPQFGFRLAAATLAR